jgi:hypothetical protein
MDIKLRIMKKKIFIIAVFPIALLLSCNKNTKVKIPDNTGDSTSQNKRKWLKEYALCSCIKYSFKDDTAIKNDLSFTVYKEITDYGNLAVYRTMDSISKIAAFDIKPSQIADYNGKKALLLGCIEYYQSKKLDSIIRKLEIN